MKRRLKMVFDEKKYTEDSIIKQLTLIQLHSTDGSAVDAGCSCIEGKHLHALEGLAEEGTMTAETPQEKAFYENLADVARATRKAIEEQKFGYMPHNPVKKLQCPYCIDVLEGKVRLARHIHTHHPEKEEEWIKTGGDNPYPRKYLPHGLTECEKSHPHVLRKLSRCIRKVEKREGCTPPYTDCPVNPVAVCRASVKCP